MEIKHCVKWPFPQVFLPASVQYLPILERRQDHRLLLRCGTISAKSKDAGDSKSKNCTLNCTLEELAVLRLLKANSKATQEQLAEQIHRSPRTVKTLTSRLTEKGYLTRRNGKRDGWWEVLIEIPEAQGG